MIKKLQKSCNLNICKIHDHQGSLEKIKKNVNAIKNLVCIFLFAGQYSSPSSACLVLKSKKT
jgi:hypothetical protein